MKSLPPQVWVAIARFIPALCLKDMLSVNRFFFNLAMDYRYRQISFTYLNERMVWLLLRLRDSAIAQRVKTLYIYPDFLKRELYTNHAQEDVKISSDVLRHKILLKSGKCGLPAKFIIEFMQDVLSKLPNVSEYHITWTGLPLTCLSNNPAQIFSSIFASAPIRRLTITISLENLSYLDAQVFSRLSCLEELRMVLHSEIPTSTVLPIPATPDLLMYSTTDFLTFTSSSTTLASAINYVRNTLKTLEIEIRGPSPLGSFLPLINDIPNLEKLLVSLPIDGDIQFDNDHSALSTFIDRHSATLRVLALRAEQPIFSLGGRRGGSSSITSVNSDPDPFFLDTRFQKSLQNIRQTRLRSLDLNTTHIPIDTCLACIGTFRSTLVSLSLTGQYQSLSFIEEVLEELEVECDDGRCGLRELRLRELRLGSVVLTPNLMDLLSEKAPRLEKLCLLVKDVASSSSPSPLSSAAEDCCGRREQQIESFFAEMSKRRYREWQLKHIKLVLSMPDVECWQSQVEMVLGECIPSIRTFA
ncbi:hypothetical protein F5887DRAFT_989881 [Amanita rubescens]|nr:hypothetical protein F5887DRAFT_989881 [Amanita rubescens]